MLDETQLDYWPEDVQRVFAALGRSIEDRRLHPDILSNVSAWESIVEGHAVTVSHTSKSELGGKSGRYTITIAGRRWAGATWHFWPGQLEQLARAAAVRHPDTGRPLPPSSLSA